MKSKRRHELQHNVLADWLNTKLQAVLPYWKTILAGVIGVGAILIAVVLFSQKQKINEESQAFFAAEFLTDTLTREERFDNLAKQFQGTAPALLSLIRRADELKSIAERAIFNQRESAVNSLREAEELYQKVLSSAPGRSPFRTRALLGLGQTYEFLGDLEKAEKHYQDAAQDSPNSVLAVEAKRRRDKLVDPDTNKLRPEMVAFYREFSNYDPNDYQPLPDRPSLLYPGSLSAEEPDKKDDKPKDDQKSDDGKMPADDNKSEDGKKPADDKKPSDDKKETPPAKDDASPKQDGEKKPADKKDAPDTTPSKPAPKSDGKSDKPDAPSDNNN